MVKTSQSQLKMSQSQLKVSQEEDKKRNLVANACQAKTF